MTDVKYTAAQMEREFLHTAFARLLVRSTTPDGSPASWRRYYFAAPTYAEAAQRAYAYANELSEAKRAEGIETGVVRRAKLEDVPHRRRVELMDRKRNGTLAVPENVVAPIVHNAPAQPVAPAFPSWSDLEV